MCRDIGWAPTRAAADALVDRMSKGLSDQVFRSVPVPTGGFAVRGWSEAEVCREGEELQRFVEDMSHG